MILGAIGCWSSQVLRKEGSVNCNMHYVSFDQLIFTLLKKFRGDMARTPVICMQRNNTSLLNATEHFY